MYRLKPMCNSISQEVSVLLSNGISPDKKYDIGVIIHSRYTFRDAGITGCIDPSIK